MNNSIKKKQLPEYENNEKDLLIGKSIMETYMAIILVRAQKIKQRLQTFSITKHN